MPDALRNGLVFFVTVTFDLYVMVLMLRFILCLARADYFNPITRFIILLTQRIINPLRYYIPNYKNVELATLLVMFIFDLVKFTLVGFIAYEIHNPLGLLILTIGDLLKTMCNMFFFAILVGAILSWVQQSYSPAGRFLALVSAPIMRPIHRVVPPIGGVDISPIPALILLQLIVIMVAAPLLTWGISMAFT